ncbi:hypothetical protein ACGVWS_11945 [Enterobacteriaceae bacterium LUAb1]
MFQQRVEVYSGVGQEGQPASNSPIVAAAGGPDAFKAGDNGLVMSRFVWRDDTDPKKLNNTGTGKPVGFLMNNANAVIGHLQAQSMMLSPGFAASPVVAADMWAKSLTDATIGQKVFAVLADGTIKTDDEGATVAGAVETDWYVSNAAVTGELIVISTWSKS